jgi:antitoxin component of MazEF toxin-antitoxin module
MISIGVDPMTTQIVRVGNTLTVEIPEELVVQAALPVGEPVEWVPNGSGSLSLVKKTILEGLGEIEKRVANIDTELGEILDVARRAEQGSPEAQYYLGITSLVAGDGAEAAKWFRLAAEQGDTESQQYLGEILIDGKGVQVDIAEGYFWLFLSASSKRWEIFHNPEIANRLREEMHKKRRNLQRIAKSLTQAERTRIEARCRDWASNHGIKAEYRL